MDSEKGSRQELERQSQRADSLNESFPRTDTDGNAVAGKDHALDNSDVEGGVPQGISAEHRDYLIARHGTADLDPLPTMDPADPLNWPAWKVSFARQILVMVTDLEIRKTPILYWWPSTQ